MWCSYHTFLFNGHTDGSGGGTGRGWVGIDFGTDMRPKVKKTTLLILIYIYIFIAIAIDETDIRVAVHFSMKNIYQSCDLRCAFGRSNVDVSQ